MPLPQPISHLRCHLRPAELRPGLTHPLQPSQRMPVVASLAVNSVHKPDSVRFGFRCPWRLCRHLLPLAQHPIHRCPADTQFWAISAGLTPSDFNLTITPACRRTVGTRSSKRFCVFERAIPLRWRPAWHSAQPALQPRSHSPFDIGARKGDIQTCSEFGIMKQATSLWCRDDPSWEGMPWSVALPPSWQQMSPVTAA